MSVNSNVAEHSEDAQTAGALMARYPGPVSIYPDAGKLSGVIIIGLAFVVLCVWLIFYSIWSDPVKTALVAICGGYFAWQSVGLARLLSGAPLLTLRSDGLFVTNGFRRLNLPWSDVDESVVLRYGIYVPWSFVGIKYRKRRAAKPPSVSLIRLPKVQPMTPADLVALINSWRMSALADAARPDLPH